MAEVRFAPEAVARIAEISWWWRTNRLGAPELFDEELAAAVALLAGAPSAGRRVVRRNLPGLRRLLLPGTRQHVYYLEDVSAGQVVVISVWSAMRRRGPRLRVP